MRVLIYPADDYGCGHHRLIWPGTALQLAGHDVMVVGAGDRRVRMHYADGKLTRVEIPDGVDVVVFQRVTDHRLLDAITALRDSGVAVVVDVDDDLLSIHPENPAWHMLNPNRAKHEVAQAVRLRQLHPRDAPAMIEKLSAQYHNSWHHLTEACKRATLVTVSTPGLLPRYAGHGRGRVLANYAPDHYLALTHDYTTRVIGWPAALHSHPNDPPPVGGAIYQLQNEGAEFMTIGSSRGVAAAFGLRAEPPGRDCMLDDWPYRLAEIGIGIAPLADTRFNASKSWLKPLELSAVGVPWVASPRAEYRRLHELGAGALAKQPRDWYRALRRLWADEAVRREQGEANRAVAESLRLSSHVWRHWEAWSDALAIQRGGARNLSAPGVVTSTHG